MSRGISKIEAIALKKEGADVRGLDESRDADRAIQREKGQALLKEAETRAKEKVGQDEDKFQDESDIKPLKDVMLTTGELKNLMLIFACAPGKYLSLHEKTIFEFCE